MSVLTNGLYIAIFSLYNIVHKMKIRLIPCFISSSTRLVDSTARLKDLAFDHVMPRFGINLDAICPSNFKGTEIVSEGNDFMKLFKEIEQKAIIYWQDFEKKTL